MLAGAALLCAVTAAAQKAAPRKPAVTIPLGLLPFELFDFYDNGGKQKVTAPVSFPQ